MERFVGPDAGETRAPLPGVPVSAEERLAALLRDAANDFTPRGPATWDSIAARLIAAGVSVPTEPGPPDPLTDAEVRRANEIAATAPDTEVGRLIVRLVALASQPVPAPEPSARLDAVQHDLFTLAQTSKDREAILVIARRLDGLRDEPSARLRKAATEAARVLDQVAREHRERLRQGDLIGAKVVELAAEGLRAATPQDPEA